jgi:patatin-like phospholipase/acyl hydrolase
MAPYYILSMDGGGIRGIITASLLERLEEAHPGFLAKIDLFAGTSTGGILALGLASGLSPREARELYEECGQKVFADTVLDDIRDLGSLIGADYSIEPLKEVLSRQFNDLRLADLPKKVLIASFDLDNKPSDPLMVRTWKPKFFHNYPGDDSDGDQKVVDVAIRTSAAPTYFPIYQGYIDGGVVASNPAICALAQALEPSTGRQQLVDLRLLSMGTGFNPRYLKEMNSDWGLVQWAPHLVNLMLEGSIGTVEYQCRQILGEACMRINPLLPVPIAMDRVDQIPLMEEIAAKLDLSEAIAWLEKYLVSPVSGADENGNTGSKTGGAFQAGKTKPLGG